jgi:hypothetical protein
VNIFDLDQTLISDYEHFARSFAKIRASDIRTQVEALYASGFVAQSGLDDRLRPTFALPMARRGV